MKPSQIFNSFKCKVCSSTYWIDINRIDRIPVWLFENCSEACTNICSSNKIINQSSCIILPMK